MINGNSSRLQVTENPCRNFLKILEKCFTWHIIWVWKQGEYSERKDGLLCNDRKYTLEEIGDELNISSDRARKIKQAALEKLGDSISATLNARLNKNG